MNIIESINQREEDLFKVGDLVQVIEATPRGKNIFWYHNIDFSKEKCIVTKVDDIERCGGCFTCYAKETSTKQYVEIRTINSNKKLSSCAFVLKKIKPKYFTKEYSRNIYSNRRNK